MTLTNIAYTVCMPIKERIYIMTIDSIKLRIADIKPRSAWDRGVLVYAHELLENLAADIEYGYQDEDVLANQRLLYKALLNGAHDWEQYSWGGCSLIYNEDIAKRLCNPTELKRTDNGRKRPNATEEWLDVQARALNQAATRIVIHAFN